MAGITDLDRNYLNLLMKNYPEYKAGLYTSTPELGMRDLYNPPTGPLYDVQPDSTSDSYFEEGAPIPTGASPVGPLHDVNIEGTQAIFDSLDQDLRDPNEVTDPSNTELHNWMDTIQIHPDESISQLVSPAHTTSFAEWQPKLNVPIPEEAPLSDIGLRDYAKEYPGKIVWGSNNPLLGIQLNKDLMDLFGTQPTSPRNEELIDASAVGLGSVRPAMLNNFVADVLAHEYGHGILDKPGFERIKEEAIGTNINELFGNNPATPHVDQPDLSNYEKEEIFNELLDLQRGFRTSGRFSGILASKNPTYMNWKLNKFMKNKPKWGSAAMDYTNLMSPVADKYFAEVERQGGQNPSAQSFRSAPGGLTQAQSRAARGDPKGTGGGWKWADGGLATMFERR
jgi:hypothetical protein